MAQVTCSRCFAVFEAEGLRPGQAPLCPACAPRRGIPVPDSPALTPLRMPALTPAPGADRAAPPARPRRPAPVRAPPRRRRGRTAAGVAVALLAAAGAAALLLSRARPPPVAPAPDPIAERAMLWKQQGLASAVAPGLNPKAIADQRVTAGRQALAADLAERIPEALRAFRDALAADPTRLDALAGWVIALSSQPWEEISPEDLTAAHELLAWARERNPERPELVAAYARLLLAVPGERNRAEALSVAWKAGALAPNDPDSRLALGLSRLHDDPEGAVRVLDAELDRPGFDRRLLTAAARARWAAGDVARALALAERRLALDPGHPAAMELQAEILLSGGDTASAKAVLQRYAAAQPASPRPPFLLARLAAQQEAKPAEARQLLGRALSLRPDDFLAARILAHLAAVERSAGDAAAARRAVEEALRRVPASAEAQFQAALLAFERGDARAVREAAGVVGDRGGPGVEAALRARSLELSATAEDAAAAWEASAAAVPWDPAATLVAAGALARLGFGPRAARLCERVWERDLAEARLRRAITDYWDGAPPLAESVRRLSAAARGPAGEAGAVLVGAAAAELLLARAARAEALGQRALSLAPQLASASALLGFVAEARGDPRAAAAWARGALELHPGLPSALAIQARALEAAGRRLEAQGVWREALDAAPDLATGRLALARLLALDGRPAEARALLEPLAREHPELVDAAGALRGLGGAAPP